jgi:hypothetical protein
MLLRLAGPKGVSEMATSVQQAEANLRTAALEFDALQKKYDAACKVEREREGSTWPDGKLETFAPEWHVACRARNAAASALEVAALELAAALRDEQHAEAL